MKTMSVNFTLLIAARAARRKALIEQAKACIAHTVESQMSRVLMLLDVMRKIDVVEASDTLCQNLQKEYEQHKTNGDSKFTAGLPLLVTMWVEEEGYPASVEMQNVVLATAIAVLRYMLWMQEELRAVPDDQYNVFNTMLLASARLQKERATYFPVINRPSDG